jgi:hypothetical protein
MDRCAECGRFTAEATCETLFHQLLALDHSRQEPWGPLHGVAVGTYFLQHPTGQKPAALRPQWSLAHAYLAGGLPRIEAMTRRVRQLNANSGSGRKPEAADYGDAPPLPSATPTAYAVTIGDVAVDGTFPAEGYAERVRAWVSATIEARTSASSSTLPR